MRKGYAMSTLYTIGIPQCFSHFSIYNFLLFSFGSYYYIRLQYCLVSSLFQYTDVFLDFDVIGSDRFVLG